VAALFKEKDLLQNPRILDLGAGIGSSVPFWHSYFPGSEIACLDVSKRSIEIGESRNGHLIKFVRFDDDMIPFPFTYWLHMNLGCVQ